MITHRALRVHSPLFGMTHTCQSHSLSCPSGTGTSWMGSISTLSPMCLISLNSVIIYHVLSMNLTLYEPPSFNLFSFFYFVNQRDGLYIQVPLRWLDSRDKTSAIISKLLSELRNCLKFFRQKILSPQNNPQPKLLILKCYFGKIHSKIVCKQSTNNVSGSISLWSLFVLVFISAHVSLMKNWLHGDKTKHVLEQIRLNQ